MKRVVVLGVLTLGAVTLNGLEVLDAAAYTEFGIALAMFRVQPGFDDKIDDLHYYTTFIKFGIGRATYDAAQEIRSRDITRDEGVALVRRFDGEFPERFRSFALGLCQVNPPYGERFPYNDSSVGCRLVTSIREDQ